VKGELIALGGEGASPEMWRLEAGHLWYVGYPWSAETPENTTASFTRQHSPNGEGASQFNTPEWSSVANDKKYSPKDSTSMWWGNGPTHQVRVVASHYTGGAEMVVAQCAIGAAGQASRFHSRHILLLRQHMHCVNECTAVGLRSAMVLYFARY
jgi:hypothetical protein